MLSNANKTVPQARAHPKRFITSLAVGMHTVNKEADHKTQTRTAAPPLFRTAKGEIAKQAAAVNGQDERATPAVDSRRLFCFAADKAVKPKSA